YVRARALELSGRKAQAQPILEALAREPNYHGFLASERLGTPYAICPQDPAVPAEVAAAIARDPSLVRAFELYALGWLTEARREWSHALRDASPEYRRGAVLAAHARSWIERGPLTLLRPEESRLYALRFPVAHEAEIRAAAKQHGLDPALVFALIRSESAWATDARSGADAHGLMQLIPAAARHIAQREKLPYRTPSDLYDPKLNVVLGTHHLATDLARYGGKVWLAAAAYNAGPAPVRRWSQARGGLPPDLFVETIPYRETREYVSRVIAFSVIYDWRINGDAASVANRIAVASKGPGRRPVACPTPAASAP
ncbi:MAG TPA: transglycosylase SLT domain-containing protein, partial [Xanthomonadales bacterium]|nr:transglycosylase SLT domain-containing protein [Xanthomonadales bacterium]